jgi:viologen exporter family transport system permease protein
VGFVTATAARLPSRNFPEVAERFGALAAIGYRRYATYRQATFASLTTNTMFGFLRSYVLLAVLAAGATAGTQSAPAGATIAGYSGPQLLSFVWLGQGLIGVVMLWGWQDLAERIRTGDVVMDLLRPQHPVVTYLAQDLGRAAYAVLVRFAPPLVVGVIFFDLWLPQRVSTYLLGTISIALGVVVSFGCRFLVNACSYWLLDNNGPLLVWLLASGVLGGLYFPLRFLPAPAMWALWLGTPFPSILQAPLDVLTERDGVPGSWAILGIQVFWAVAVLCACVLVQRRAERKLVVQGG